jgi:predicted NUDIX family phosphoesterase
MDEQVLVFPEGLLTPYLGAFRDCLLEDEAEVGLLVKAALARSSFVSRGPAETDPSVKQLIPYCLLVRGDRVLAYRRSKSGGEGRLHGLWSVGVGGHINPVDGGRSGDVVYVNGLLRELKEEVGLWPPPSRPLLVGGPGKVWDGILRPRAVLYDPSNEVGRVHVGVVHVIDVTDECLQASDEALAEVDFYPLADLVGRLDSMERWSQVAMRCVIK